MTTYRTLDTLSPSLPLLYLRRENTLTAATRLRDCWRTVWRRLPDSARGAMKTITHFRREWRLPGGSVYVRSHVEDIDTLPTTYARFNAPSASYFFLAPFIHTLTDSLLEALIAHEHAHAVLWAMDYRRWHDDEDKVNELVEEWGFPMTDLIEWANEAATA